MFFSETVHAVDLLLALYHPNQPSIWENMLIPLVCIVHIFWKNAELAHWSLISLVCMDHVCHIIVCVSIYASSSMFLGILYLWWLVAKLNEQASSTGHPPSDKRNLFYCNVCSGNCTINSRSFNLKSYNKKSSVTYCFKHSKKMIRILPNCSDTSDTFSVEDVSFNTSSNDFRQI